MNTYCPLTRNFAYAMAKSAVENFTKSLAAYFGEAGVRINAVAPGFIVNERSKVYLGTVETGLTARGQKVIDHTPMGRFGEADEIFGCIKSGSNEAMEIIKNFMTEELYDKLVTQRKKFERDGLEFITENLLIEKCSIYDYYKGISREEILILINATMVEYIINKKTNEIVRGDRYKEYNKNILMTFSRQNTKEYEGLIHNCPNCGAKVTKTELGKCGYCSTLLIPIRYNWTLTKFETM